MRKILFVLVMALMSQLAIAQSPGYCGYVDERDLIGTWQAFGSQGDLESIGFTGSSIEGLKITFSEDGKADLGQIKHGYNQVVDWFVSNTNKLHFLTITQSVRFLIWNYVEGSLLILSNNDGSARIHFSKVEPSSVRAITSPESNDSSMYNLQGMKISNQEGVFIQNGKKYIAK